MGHFFSLQSKALLTSCLHCLEVKQNKFRPKRQLLNSAAFKGYSVRMSLNNLLPIFLFFKKSRLSKTELLQFSQWDLSVFRRRSAPAQPLHLCGSDRLPRGRFKRGKPAFLTSLTPSREMVARRFLLVLFLMIGRVNLEVGDSSKGVEARGTDVFQSGQRFRLSTHNRQGKASQQHTARHRLPSTKPPRHSAPTEECRRPLRASCRGLL